MLRLLQKEDTRPLFQGKFSFEQNRIAEKVKCLNELARIIGIWMLVTVRSIVSSLESFIPFFPLSPVSSSTFVCIQVNHAAIRFLMFLGQATIIGIEFIRTT